MSVCPNHRVDSQRELGRVTGLTPSGSMVAECRSSLKVKCQVDDEVISLSLIRRQLPDKVYKSVGVSTVS